MKDLPYWNWQQADWPDFRFERGKLDAMEAQFLRQSGVFSGCIRHISGGDREQITVDLISEEALNTSEIEGEILNRDSLQSSIRRNFGLATDNRRIPPAELIPAKVRDHRREDAECVSLLQSRSAALKAEPQLREDFLKEMCRFLPALTVRDTLENPAWWAYLTQVIEEQVRLALAQL